MPKPLKVDIPPYSINSKILSQVSDIVELITDIKHINSIYNSPKLRKKNRVRSITGSLQIEGHSFGEEQVTNVINGKTVLGTVRELAEVQGAIKAYDQIDRYNFKQQNDLLLCHQLLMDELLTNAGHYRDGNIGVGGKDGVKHIAPPPNRVPALMNNLFSWLANTSEHQLIVSCVFHYEFEFIHPFSDGNGRMGRLWQMLILMDYKDIFGFIPVESMIREHQQAYYDALQQSGNLGESTPFIEFMLDIIYQTLQNVPKEVPNDVPKERDIKILNLMDENKNITIKELALYFQVNEKTIKREIDKLKSMNKILRIGSPRKGHWQVIGKNTNEV